MNDKTYQKILNSVKNGNTIKNSCKKLGVNSKNLYNKLSKKQRDELVTFKALNNKASKVYFRISIKELEEYIKTLSEWC